MGSLTGAVALMMEPWSRKKPLQIWLYAGTSVQALYSPTIRPVIASYSEYSRLGVSMTCYTLMESKASQLLLRPQTVASKMHVSMTPWHRRCTCLNTVEAIETVLSADNQQETKHPGCCAPAFTTPRRVLRYTLLGWSRILNDYTPNHREMHGG
jgi:hypothetical protein